ncbi:MAG: diphosphomevalonate decarboxylase [Sandaracinaceae bacterium]
MSGQASAAKATACANIALAKYWGKADDTLNLPAVPSVSITLDPLVTETTVVFDAALDADRFELDGEPAREGELKRVTALLDEVRREAGLDLKARVKSDNRFPTAAGLASSASGFAALAGAASAAAGLSPSLEELSARARRASASAARSIFGGFVELPAGREGRDDLAARQLAKPDHWDLRVVVAVTAEGRKPVGSRSAMGESRHSSMFYDAWVEGTRRLTTEIEDALMERDFARLAPLVEQSFFAMHGVAMASIPPVLYWQSGSVAALHAVRRLREDEGLSVCATMDAGPHVKAICTAADADAVVAGLEATDGVLRTIVTKPGPGISIERISVETNEAS